MKKENKKFIFGIIIGALVFGGVGVAYAANVLSSNVSYSNTNSKMGASNVSDALDELYEMAKSGGGSGELYWTYDANNDIYPSFYTSGSSLISETGEHVYLKLQSNSHAQACLNLNNEEFCLNNNEYETSVSKLNTYFGSSNCETTTEYGITSTKCSKDGFACDADVNGFVYCRSASACGAFCSVSADGNFSCNEGICDDGDDVGGGGGADVN